MRGSQAMRRDRTDGRMTLGDAARRGLARGFRRRAGAARHRRGRGAVRARSATGATSSPSPGTSRRWRAAAASRRCWPRRSDDVAPSALAHRRRGQRRATASSRPGSRFETGVARGRGYLRLSDGRCWTLLTTMDELKGFEERKGARPATRHRATASAAATATGARSAPAEEAALGTTRQPYCVIVGGGQGGIALGARLKQLGVPTIILEKQRAARAIPGATATSRSCCTTPSGTTTCPTCRSPTTGRSSRRRTSWRLAGSLRQDDGARLLGLARMRDARLRRGQRTWTRRGRARRPGDRAASEAAGARHRRLWSARSESSCRAPNDFAGEILHSSGYQTGEAYAGKHCHRDRRQHFRA